MTLLDKKYDESPWLDHGVHKMQWKLLLLLLLVFTNFLLHAESSPVPMLEKTADQIISSLKQNKSQLKQNHHIIHQTVERYLLPHVDVIGMSRSVLGRKAWNAASNEEKKEFSQVFTQLVIRTYAKPLAEYTSETIKFEPLRSAASGQFVRVNSIIYRPNGQRIPISYNLVAKNSEWKIYDLSVEGVSLLQSFRSQFAQILQNSSMKDLIAQMRKNGKAAA